MDATAHRRATRRALSGAGSSHGPSNGSACLSLMWLKAERLAVLAVLAVIQSGDFNAAQHTLSLLVGAACANNCTSVVRLLFSCKKRAFSHENGPFSHENRRSYMTSKSRADASNGVFQSDLLTQSAPGLSGEALGSHVRTGRFSRENGPVLT